MERTLTAADAVYFAPDSGDNLHPGGGERQETHVSHYGFFFNGTGFSSLTQTSCYVSNRKWQLILKSLRSPFYKVKTVISP